MEQKKARKAGIMDILRSPYAHRFFKKYKWSYLLGACIGYAAFILCGKAISKKASPHKTGGEA